MAKEMKYRCKDNGKNKDCLGDVVISEDVYRMMSEKGESLPERCANCRKSHQGGKRETRQSYIAKDIKLPFRKTNRFDFSGVAFTPHENRNKKEEVTEPDMSGMRIRITDDHIKELYES